MTSLQKLIVYTKLHFFDIFFVGFFFSFPFFVCLLLVFWGGVLFLFFLIFFWGGVVVSFLFVCLFVCLFFFLIII